MAEKISFSTVQLKSGVTPLTAPNELTSLDVGTTTSVTNRVLAAIAGDGDKLLEAGETGYVLAGYGLSSRLASSATLNTAADPVTITANGRLQSNEVGNLVTDGVVTANALWGFGLDNGVEGGGRFLNNGDSITWALNPTAGVAQALVGFSFVIDRNGSTAATEVAFDFDGNVLRSGSYVSSQNAANADAALRLVANGGDTVAVDFANRILTVNGIARSGTDIDGFFAAYSASPQNVLTIGGITTAGFSVRDLVLERADLGAAPVNAAPTLALDGTTISLAANTVIATPLKVADIVITDDGVGRNALSLTGADAAMFQISGNSLYLKAGTLLDLRNNPVLDVSVVVDDATIGSGPEATASLGISLTSANPGRISFGLVQLRSGVTALTAPNELGVTDLGTTTTTTNRAFVAIVGDGDRLLEGDETAFVLAGAGSASRITYSDRLNTAADPVTFTAQGRINSATVGTLSPDAAVRYEGTWGFGIDNGAETSGRLLNGGDSITFTLNDKAAVAQKLTGFSFVVDTNGVTAATEVAFDFDGNVVRTGNYAASQNGANANAALRLEAFNGDTIAVDFTARVLTVNGIVRSSADITAFFAARDGAAQNVITVGSIGNTGFSVRDLVLDEADVAAPPVNLPPGVALANITASLPENTDLSVRMKVADIVITDDGQGSNALSLGGADAELFEIEAGQLFLKAGVLLNFETAPRLDVTVLVDDATIGASPDASVSFSLTVADVNEAPAIALANALTTLPENTDLATAQKVADIVVTDDVLGANQLSLTGADAGLFEIIGTGLYLKAGQTLDAFSNPQLDVSVVVDDPAIGVAVAEGSAPLAIQVTRVSPQVGTVTIDGSVAEWTAATRLDAAGGGVNGLAIYGDYQANTFLLAIATTGISIGQDTTIWLNTDLNRLTGEPVFGPIGAEYNINIGADGRPVLYTGVAGGTLVSAALSFAYSADGTVLEIALPSGLMSGAPRISDVYVDINNAYFVPSDYAFFQYRIGENLPASVALTNVSGALAENSGSAVPLKVADIVVTDEGLGTNTLTLTGTDAEMFEIVGNGLFLKANAVLDFETNPSLDVTVSVDDPAVGTITPDSSVTLGLAVTDVNEAPNIALTGLVTTLAENTVITAPLKVANIAVTDDALGTNTLSLAGDDAAMFEIGPDGLYLRAGVTLDFESNPLLDVRVQVDDPALGTGIEAEAPFSLQLGDLAENYGLITLDGALGDWAGSMRLDTPTTGAPGNAVYGTYQDNSFVLALKVDVGNIGPNTTVWFNTDMNSATGFQVFGSTVGAEYNINFGADGKPALYTGAAGETLVTTALDYAFNADGSVLEIALPSSLLAGAPRQTNLALDINNATFLPNDYAGYSFQVGEQAPLLPKDPGTRVAIVYSETTANAYFDKTAYGQLFMAAQNQAMQAGIPFDLIQESALTDIATLVKYDSIIMPGLSNVRAADLAAISTTLTSAVKDYGIGIVTMGNFLTNDETGAAFSGDAYARMKQILGVTLDGFGDTAGVTVRAVDGSHPVSDLYGTGEVVGTYNTGSYQTFRDVSGTGRTLFTQDVDGATTAPTTVAAVIATTINDARNVQFATDAVFGNNNILSEAINWSARGTAPDVGLQMTRGSSLFFSRDDMDQSQETFDVQSSPGIYDAMLPIVEKWFTDYGFVGSYYINVGADAPDQATDWAISKPYYDRLLAMGSEIGTHSFTHPANTNTLLPDTFSDVQRLAWIAGLDPTVAGSVKAELNNMTLAETQSEMARLLALTNPASPSAVDPSTLSAVEREILKGSIRFQFDYARQIIERELGITLDGAAVSGAPEKLAASLEILKYAGYLTGGYSGIGAGYPGAFGFLSPDKQDQVYLAPNVTFDFTLIGFQNLTAAQAEAVWANEYASIIAKGTAPIITFPWHDYGPTNWPDGTVSDPGYRLAMYTNFIARAAADGTEFLTGSDLAQRIKSFAASTVEITTSGSTVTAKVTGSDVGKFALDVDTTQMIASVKDWYAFDGKKVFLPSNGGTFEITLGTEAADVTRITSLPMRAELVSASGNGSDLAFALNGQGTTTVALKTWGTQSVIASGADSGTLTGDTLSLSFAALGSRSVGIAYTAAGTVEVAGTVLNDVIVGSTGDSRINGGLGDDALYGNAGADTFVFATASGEDVVQDFSAAAGDLIELVNSGFASLSAALDAFIETADGLLLTYSNTDQLLIADVTKANFGVDNILLTNDTLFT